ncbi:MAG: hypothetical protein R3B93_09420 [Bacteroidia bacterium]
MLPETCLTLTELTGFVSMRFSRLLTPQRRRLDEGLLGMALSRSMANGVEEIEMAVPISPIELRRKREAIFKHQSQKDSALFPGSDPREFWQRAEDRNKGTARIYDSLGLPEYEAIEAFVRYRF